MWNLETRQLEHPEQGRRQGTQVNTTVTTVPESRLQTTHQILSPKERCSVVGAHNGVRCHGPLQGICQQDLLQMLPPNLRPPSLQNHKLNKPLFSLNHPDYGFGYSNSNKD